MTFTVRHNPNCPVSRKVLGLIRASGVEPKIIPCQCAAEHCRHQGIAQLNSASISSCGAWPASLSSLGQLRVAAPFRNRVRREVLQDFDTAPDVHHLDDVSFDKFERCHDLADALAGQVLEIAGFKNLHDPLPDVADEVQFVLGFDQGGQRIGALIGFKL